MEINNIFIIVALIIIFLILLYIIFSLKQKIKFLKKQLNSRRDYKTFLESLPVPVFHNDSSGHVDYTNLAFDISFGANKNKTIQIFKKLLKKPMEQLELNYDNNIQKRSIILTSNIFGDHYNIIGRVGVVFDISSFKKDITALLAWKQRYSLAVDEPEFGLWDWNILENDFYFSNQWKKIMGYKSTDKPNNLNSWLSLVDARDMARVNEELNKHLSGKNKIFDIEHRVRLDKGVGWVHIRGKAIFDHDIATRMTGLIYDITHRKILEEIEYGAQRYFPYFMDNLPGIAFIKDIDSKYIYINMYFENILGFKRWKNKTPKDLFDDTTAEHILENDRKAFFHGQKRYIEILVDKEGQKREFEIRKFTISDENGEKFLCGIGTEITD